MSKEIVYRKLSELKKLPNNPRTIKKEDMERLKESVKNNQDYFEARPLILSDRTGELVIIAGNQRYEAAKALGMEEVPTFLLSGLTEERERDARVVKQSDALSELGKSLYGGGLLVSDKIAEKAAAEKAAIKVVLSKREQAIVDELNANDRGEERRLDDAEAVV